MWKRSVRLHANPRTLRNSSRVQSGGIDGLASRAPGSLRGAVEQAGCPFCEVATDDVVAESRHAVAIRDGFPVSDGHTLVIPRAHARTLFAHSAAVQADVWALVARVRDELQSELRPDGFNIGLNDGPAAGQTVDHAHVHIIPRVRRRCAGSEGWPPLGPSPACSVLGSMNAPRPPTAKEQLAFLQSLQRLMDEGSFVASYKFALLHAIADLCLVKGDDSGAELELSTADIAAQFVGCTGLRSNRTPRAATSRS